MKKIRQLLVTLLAILNLSVIALAQSHSISVFHNDAKLSFPVPPRIVNGTTLVPMRTIFERLGYELQWNDLTKTITGFHGNNILQISINENFAFQNGQKIPLATPAVIDTGNTLVPLRFVAESSGASVTWDGVTQAIYIYTPDYQRPMVPDIPVDSTVFDVESARDTVVTLYTDNTQGSGVILSPDGHIVTNFHVLEGENSVAVQFNDGTSYWGDVTVVGYDIAADIVILKIDETDLPYAKIGDVNSLIIGDEVIAIGSPLGKPNVVSHGTLESFRPYIIGSNTKIDNGSSGGALFGINGEVLGITSSVNSLGFTLAIPIHTVATIELNKNIPISSWGSKTPVLETPKYVDFTSDGSDATLSWSPVYGAQYFKVFISSSEDSGYEPLKDSAGVNKWGWGYPHSISISNTVNEEIYVKVVTVLNGKESPLSPPYKLIHN